MRKGFEIWQADLVKVLNMYFWRFSIFQPYLITLAWALAILKMPIFVEFLTFFVFFLALIPPFPNLKQSNWNLAYKFRKRKRVSDMSFDSSVLHLPYSSTKIQLQSIFPVYWICSAPSPPPTKPRNWNLTSMFRKWKGN